MASINDIFKPDRNHLIAVVAMLAAVAMFAIGEIAFGAVFFVVAAAFSLGGLFWSAHRQDKADAIEWKKVKEARNAEKAAGAANPPDSAAGKE